MKTVDRQHSKPPKSSVTTLQPGMERLERAIAHDGLASRREAKSLIMKGLVSVNGTVVREPGFGVKIEKDIIEIKAGATADKESYLVYKARGIETTRTSGATKDLKDVFPKLKHLSPIGRLDKDSEGLIIMSNDGTLTKALTKEESSIGKTYRVVVRENVTDASILKMSRGIVLDKVLTRPAVVKRISRTSFSITLFEGRKHQIRRMCDACHLTIETLTRISIGHLSSVGMKPGNAKRLTVEDVMLLKK